MDNQTRDYLAEKMGKLTFKQQYMLNRKIVEELDVPPDGGLPTYVDALLLFANEPAKLCELIVEADKEGK